MEKVAFFFLGVLFFTTMCGTDTIKDFYKLVFLVFFNESGNIFFFKKKKRGQLKFALQNHKREAAEYGSKNILG